MTSKKSVRPDDRISTLRLRQFLKMAHSAHVYVRGSTVKFYEWLGQQKRGALPEGPAVDGRVDIQIRDLNQTVIGNPAHDIIRLALSLATASRGSDLPGVTTARILEQVIEGYQAALRRDAEGAQINPVRDETIDRAVLEASRQRTPREHEADDSSRIPILGAIEIRTGDHRGIIPDA